MASFKALCLAGVASLVATAAYAADLLPPPPAPVYAPPPAVVGGGWYLRGDVGVGITDIAQQGSTFNSRVPVPGLRYDSSFIDDQGFIGGGAGYRFNEYFRGDITGEYRGASHYTAVESYSAGYGARGTDKYDGSISSIVGLANGYIDLGTWWCLTPFVGGGVGVSRVGFHNVIDTGFEAGSGGFGYGGTNYSTNFTWAAMAGVAVAVTPNLKMEIGYRYLDQGKIASGVINCQGTSVCPKEVQHYRLTSNDIRIGFRYTFANLAPIGPAMPLISKY